jgi:hypothetical protein
MMGLYVKDADADIYIPPRTATKKHANGTTHWSILGRVCTGGYIVRTLTAWILKPLLCR